MSGWSGVGGYGSQGGSLGSVGSSGSNVGFPERLSELRSVRVVLGDPSLGGLVLLASLLKSLISNI